MLINERIKLDPNAAGYEWAKKLKISTLKPIYNLITYFNSRFSIDVLGNRGVGHDIEIQFDKDEFEDFLEHFPWKYKTKNLKGSKSRFPFVKGKYKQTKWNLASLGEVEELLSIFLHLKPKLERVYVQDLRSCSVVKEIDVNEYANLLENETEMNKYCNSFPSKLIKVHTCYLVVGERTGQAGYFHVSFVEYPDTLGGKLRFSFCYQTEVGGFIKGAVAPKSMNFDLVDETFIPYSLDFHPFNESHLESIKNGGANLANYLEGVNHSRKIKHLNMTRRKRQKTNLVSNKSTRRKRFRQPKKAGTVGKTSKKKKTISFATSSRISGRKIHQSSKYNDYKLDLSFD